MLLYITFCTWIIWQFEFSLNYDGESQMTQSSFPEMPKVGNVCTCIALTLKIRWIQLCVTLILIQKYQNKCKSAVKFIPLITTSNLQKCQHYQLNVLWENSNELEETEYWMNKVNEQIM